MANCIFQQLIILLSVVLAVATALRDDSAKIQGPLIIPSADEIILQKGLNYTLYCTGQSPLQFKQQTIPEEVTGSFNTSLRIINSTTVALDLYNVDEFAIGYYACFDETLFDADVLKDFLEEPQNTNHISYIYVYVNGTDKLFAPMREMVKVRNGSKIAIECRPTTPDVNITLKQSNENQENANFSPKIGFVVEKSQSTPFQCEAKFGNLTSRKSIRNSDKTPERPRIVGGPKYFMDGDNFTLMCKIPYRPNTPINLNWITPNREANVIVSTNANEINNDPFVTNITVNNASIKDNGSYICTASISSKTKSRTFEKIHLEKGFVDIIPPEKDIEEISQRLIITFRVEYSAYPRPEFTFLHDDKKIIIDHYKYEMDVMYGSQSDYVQLKVRSLNITDSGQYTVHINNTYASASATKEYRIILEPPIIKFEPKTPKKFVQGTEASFLCTVVGYPLPSVQWRVNDENETMSGNDIINPFYKVESVLKVPVRESLNLTCIAGEKSETRSLLVYEIEGGFGIKNKSASYHVEGSDFKVTCLASIYDYSNVTWQNAEANITVTYSKSRYSHIATLNFEACNTYQKGTYYCVGIPKNNGFARNDSIEIVVDDRRQPEIEEPIDNQIINVKEYQSVSLPCVVTSSPISKLEWRKDGVVVEDGNDNIEIDYMEINMTIVKSVLHIKQMSKDIAGTYECSAWNGDAIASRLYDVILKEGSALNSTYIAVISVIMAALTILVIYLTWKIRKEKKFRKELDAAGLLYFKEGRKLNPNLGLDEQAALLPYVNKFEFPRNKLIIGELLGSGAFGEVYKARAQGIIDAERSEIVAVKMVSKNAQDACIRALASELKIMCHLGKHVNVVNLLGACTEDINKRELIVIVEYCEFGNLHNYLQRHREVFIDQLTDSKDSTDGNTNRGFLYSTNSAGASEYFGKNQTHETEQTCLYTGNSSRSGRRDNPNKGADVVPVSELSCQTDKSGRGSSVMSEYSDGRKPRPLYSRDLIAWAFQIARGMEYLASRKVLHGDLAVRNILLAKDNVVKICDFGLARSVYKDQEYQKKENSLLPVRWLAIECITDRIFSTQSDVWAYGIVLWELFSLAKTPYPNIHISQLHQWLTEGNRLEKPPYADDKLYEVMLQCWQEKPNTRPSFTKLQEIIGSFLEDRVKNYYMDLNTVYTDSNARVDGEDYLAMIAAPDYNNMVIPSPHHYVNETKSFFPQTPTVELQHDDEGYLQMSPANSVFPPTKFDFEKRINDSSERNSHESTPMLTLNNLPARSGSDSDHEGNTSPYQNMCPRIEEESDEVFDAKASNGKNSLNTAVSNPTYTTVDFEKKPTIVKNNANIITNAYSNVPNGLVK